MLNQIVIVGKVVDLPEIKKTVNGTKIGNVGILLNRPFKNSEGYYDTDYLSITLWKGIAETVSEVCRVNDVLAIKGRIQTSDYTKDDIVYHNYDIIAEKVSFISSELATKK
ncbi:MAG: single-stranded DNA-binding protein [Erysipelotrichaceae bacterium]